MEELIHKYSEKLIKAGLGSNSGAHSPLIGGIDDTLVWNRNDKAIPVLEAVFSGLNINSLVFLRPKEPYGSLIRHLSKSALSSNKVISPKDCETRTFLHDLPVIETFDADSIIPILKKRKSVIIASPDPAIIAHGTVSPEQGFVTISSVCFACFIKFFTDYLDQLKTGTAADSDHELFETVKNRITEYPKTPPQFMKAPFEAEPEVYKAVIEAGAQTVEYDLVDSYFGNVSYFWDNTLYISQTASSLDELSGCIDPVPLDNSTSAGLTASSELSAHLKTIELTQSKAILHGHPKFSVILSMDCDPLEKAKCDFKNECHIRCPKKRYVEHTPIVPGEVGTGPFGLCNILPRALTESDSVIVYGHGLFTTGKTDFSDAFKTMLAVETRCKDIYFNQVAALR